MTRPPKKSRRKRDSNPGPSALEADAITTRPARRSQCINLSHGWVSVVHWTSSSSRSSNGNSSLLDEGGSASQVPQASVELAGYGSVIWPDSLSDNVQLQSSDRLVRLLVKASASRAEGPGFESRLRRHFFRGRVIPVTSKLALQCLPCQAPGVIGSALGLVGPVSVYCDWVR